MDDNITIKMRPSLDSRIPCTIGGKKLLHLNPVDNANSAGSNRAVVGAPEISVLVEAK